MITGKIKFNPLPRLIKYGQFGNTVLRFKEPQTDYDHYNSELESLADSLQEHFAEMLHAIVGRIFVM